MKKLSISLVTYNSERYVPDLCDSLQAQTFKDWEIIVIDNNSSDASVTLIEEHLPQARVSRQVRNLGFSRAHNLGIAWSRSPYVLVMNPDVVLTPTCLEQLVAALTSLADASSVGPKLLSWHSETQTSADVIDSCGIIMKKNYRVFDRLQGQPDTDLKQQQVFGISGSFVMYRRDALEEVKIPRIEGGFEYFDEDFFMYKEDVDLAWRLDCAGWKQYLIPDALAYHQRTISVHTASWRGRKSRKAINWYSYRNHLLMVYKNHFWNLTLRHGVSIMMFELSKFFYLLALDRSSLAGIRDILRMLPRFKTKRAQVVKKIKISPQEFESLLE